MTGEVEARGALSITFYLLVYLLVQEHSALSKIAWGTVRFVRSQVEILLLPPFEKN